MIFIMHIALSGGVVCELGASLSKGQRPLLLIEKHKF